MASVSLTLLLMKDQNHKIILGKTNFSEFLTLESFSILSVFSTILQEAKIGTYFIAILSGFGAVNCPYAFFNFVDKKFLKENMNFLEDQIFFSLSEISEVKFRLLDLADKAKNLQEPASQGFFARNLFSFFSKDNATRKELHQQSRKSRSELKTLKKIHNELFLSTSFVI